MYRPKIGIKERSFTLIELIIVIVILGVLAGAMLPLFQKTTDTAKINKAKTDMDEIRKASWLYYADTGQWPWTWDGGPFLRNNGVSGWNGPYLTEWKKDPWGHTYKVTSFGTATTKGRAVRCDGPDGVAATKDDLYLRIYQEKK